MGLTSGQAQFASVFSHETGLNPQVVGAWLLAEQSGSAAKNYEGKGYHNWLNIANTDSGPKGGAHSAVWSNPQSAAKASAEWMRGRGQIAQEYGKPSSGITSILSSAGQVPHRQIQAIANSGWASSGYEHGTGLSSLLGQVGNIPTASGRQAAAMNFLSKGTETSSNFDRSGYEQATQHARGLRMAGNLFTGGGAGDVALREVLQRAGTPPDYSQYTSSAIVKTPTGSFYTPSSSGYVHPLPGAQIGRTDMGVDMSAPPGRPIRAIGDSKVLGVQPNWYKGQPYVELELQNGSHAGKIYYAAEQITPSVHLGQFVRGGHAIGHVATQGTGLELGWGAHGGRTQAQATTGYREGEATKAGQDFASFLKGLR